MKLLIVSLVTATFLVGCGGAATNGVKPTSKRTAATGDLIADEQDGIVKDAVKTTGTEVKNEVRGIIRGLFR